jgi:hypothetical protein
MTEDQIKSLQSTGGDHLAATEKNILGNHLNKLWDTVKTLRTKTGGRVDFILDNAGFELYCDCVYGADLPLNVYSFAHVLIFCCSRFPYSDWTR